jgi:hypothetical protein
MVSSSSSDVFVFKTLIVVSALLIELDALEQGERTTLGLAFLLPCMVLGRLDRKLAALL